LLVKAQRAKQLEVLDADIETMKRRDVELTRRAAEWGRLPRSWAFAARASDS
jgi:hypothetical protein